MELFHKIAAFLSGVSEAVWHFLAPLLAKETSKLLTQLAPIALSVVASLADQSISGAEKRAQAFAQITAAAEAAGIQAGTSIVNTVIEVAVQHLATAPTTPAA